MISKKENIPQRGDIYLVNFDSSIGSEIKKTRPALIIQNDIANKYSPVVIVSAITSQIDKKVYPNEVLILAKESGLDKDSLIVLNQIRTLDKARLIKKIGKLKKETLARVNMSLKISLGLAVYSNPETSMK